MAEANHPQSPPRAPAPMSPSSGSFSSPPTPIPPGLKALRILPVTSSSMPAATVSSPHSPSPTPASPSSKWAATARPGPASPSRSPLPCGSPHGSPGLSVSQLPCGSPHTGLIVDIPSGLRESLESLGGLIVGLAGSPPAASLVPQQRLRAQQRLRDHQSLVFRSSADVFLPHPSTQAMHELLDGAGALSVELGIDDAWLEGQMRLGFVSGGASPTAQPP